LVYTGLGDRDGAIRWLEKAYKERSDFLLVLNVDPLFDGIRSDPRFQDILRRMNFQITSSADITHTFQPTYSEPYELEHSRFGLGADLSR